MYIDQEIDVKKAFKIFDDCKSYQGIRLNYRMTDPKATVCLSKSGYIRSMGTTSLEQAKKAINITIMKLSNEGIVFDPQVVKERVENIVASGAFQDKLDLEFLAGYLSNCMYEPEQFPAIIYRPINKVTCLLFTSGKFVIVGAKSFEELTSAYVNLKNTLNNSEL